MRSRFWLATIATIVATTTASAQTTTTGTTGTGTGAGASNFQTGAASGQNNFSLATQQAAPPIGAFTPTSSSLATSNGLGQYYANPQYQGRAGSTGNDSPGGFGKALSGSTSSGSGTVGASFGGRGGTSTTSGSTAAGGRTGGTTMGTGGLGGNTGGFGGNTGGLGGTTGNRNTGIGGVSTTGNRGGSSNQQAGGVIIPLPQQITYTASAKFSSPSLLPATVQSELRTVLDRSSMLTSAQGIQVAIDGTSVVLRGTVKDEEEARTAEGLVRLTPGVKKVTNELKY